MTRVTLRVDEDGSEVEVVEESTRRVWSGPERPTLDTLLDTALSRVRAACGLHQPEAVEAERATETAGGVTLSDTNRALLKRAYDDGEHGHLEIFPSEGDYFSVSFEGEFVMEGIEVNGTLYSMIPQSGGGMVAVHVGEDVLIPGSTAAFYCRGGHAARLIVRGLTSP